MIKEQEELRTVLNNSKLKFYIVIGRKRCFLKEVGAWRQGLRTKAFVLG
jgi:hypothetical protein